LKSKKKLSAVLFDLGNVFIQVNPDNSIQELERLSSFTYQQIHTYFTTSEIVRMYEKGQLTNCEFYKHVLSDFGFSIPKQQFKMLWQSMFSLIDPMIHFLDDIRHQYPCYLLSNTNAWHIEYCQHHYPFLRWFKKLFYSYEMGAIKPDPAIFQAVFTRIGLPPEEILFVDDREENIQAGYKLGMQTVHYIEHLQFKKCWNEIQSCI